MMHLLVGVLAVIAFCILDVLMAGRPRTKPEIPPKPKMERRS